MLVGGGQNGATLYLIIFSLVAGVVGAVSCLFGLNHVTYWGPDSLPAAAAAAAIAWSLTMLALGLVEAPSYITFVFLFDERVSQNNLSRKFNFTNRWLDGLWTRCWS